MNTALRKALLFLYLIVVSIVLHTRPSSEYSTGFWYGDTRPPSTNYESVEYANLTVRLVRPVGEGPGRNLIYDPQKSGDAANNYFVGLTINRQAFDTQFVLDMSYALDIKTERIFVVNVQKGKVHFSWEESSSIVTFLILERNVTSEKTLLEVIADLTNQVQDRTSRIFTGTNVTYDIDSPYGLVVDGWDISLKLLYAIQVVGGAAVKEDYYLNQGGQAVCDTADAANISTYCEFERFFEDDVSAALAISYYRVQILFVKKAAFDAVTVHFRISPPLNTTEKNITSCIADLLTQVHDTSSGLYQGNVTIRVDSIWGVSGTMPKEHTASPVYTKNYYDYDESRLSSAKRITQLTAYDRCKANRRCNWGVVLQNQSTNDIRYYSRLFDRGTLFGVNLYLDFEDWRIGSRGFSWTGQIPPTMRGRSSIPRARAPDGVIPGAHFSPFDFQSTGPVYPALNAETTEGLVLDRNIQINQMVAQDALIDDIKGRIDFLAKNRETIGMGPKVRSRKDSTRDTIFVQKDFQEWLDNEVAEYEELSTNMCIKETCSLLFNTTSAQLTGAINVDGVVSETDGGTEVAVFTFNSIYLGPEVEVSIVGQRALVIQSRTAFVLNTTLETNPGTLGGFPGGGSVGRYEEDQLVEQPRHIYMCELGQYCASQNGSTYNYSGLSFVSNNVNGPGSGNVRINTFVLHTYAKREKEVQYVRTYAQANQTLAGGFTMKFKEYVSPLLTHDVTASAMKRALENNFNMFSPDRGHKVEQVRQATGSTGIGMVSVSRSSQDSQEGYEWQITFDSYIGDAPQIQATSYLQGLRANISTGTYVAGNEIGGTFTLSFQDATTRPISSYASAEDLRLKLLELPPVSTAFVERIDPTERCDDGLCTNGPYFSRAMLWTVYVTTNLSYDNISPTSPTSPVSLSEATYNRFTVDASGLTGLNVSAEISLGGGKSSNGIFALLNISTPFSMAFGGAGASYGGYGGRGYAANPTAEPYHDRGLSDLLGGSGGCMKNQNPFEINSVLGPVSGRGGPGGGAIELVAANDIVVGSYGKIVMKGGDAEQSSGGGGGGGSGGAILLAAGGTVVVEGLLDVSGGAGGFGGPSARELSGGGGSGGRIAAYGQSVVLKYGDVRYSGGACGIYKYPMNETLLRMNVTVNMAMLTTVGMDTLSRLAEVWVNESIDTVDIFPGTASMSFHNSTNGSALYLAQVDLTVVNVDLLETLGLNSTNSNDSTAAALAYLQGRFDAHLGVEIARVVVYNATIGSSEYVSVAPTRSIATDCANAGSNGSLYTETKTTTDMYVAATTAAEGTAKALFLSNRESTFSTSGSAREAPFSWNGPIIPFEPSRPSRVTYYTKLIAVEGLSKKANFGVLFSLLSRGESGLDVSSVIGVFTGDKITHGANFGSAVDEKTFLKRSATIWNYPVFDRWYKVDIKLNWANHTYLVALDDTVLISDVPFKGEDLDGLRISVTRAVEVWFDEIYVGFDNSLDYQCPRVNRLGAQTDGPEQRHWSLRDVSGGENPYTTYNKMGRHYSHIDPTGTVAIDGQGAVSNFQDIKLKYDSGDYPVTQGKIKAGSLQYISDSIRTGRIPADATYTLDSPKGLWFTATDDKGFVGDGRQYWYTEYEHVSDFSDTLNGGVAACSSQDLKDWRFEGIVFHYTNLTDATFGLDGPFFLERPKVKFNNNTKKYVLWATMDKSGLSSSLGQTAILESPYEDGPFLFRRSLYPDGNQTRDQVIYVTDAGTPVLARTYYQTVEYLMPQAIMQPVWESVKGRDGVIDFRISYLRAQYDVGYDNYHDIFFQRWRKEDISYLVQCQNKITGNITIINDPLADLCNDPDEVKTVLGAGTPGKEASSRFVDPSNPNNTWWLPTSVPAIVAQPWANNYRDGYCGVRKLDESRDIDDASLVDFKPDDRGNCSNIQDNPTHPTFPDKLIGAQRILSVRRAKYLALSTLTADMLGTTGFLSAFEGEFESGDLLSLIIEMGQFGFASSTEIRTTFAPPLRSEYETAIDYKTRYMQYVRNYNDRASYALACVIDGFCPVDFASQVYDGQY